MRAVLLVFLVAVIGCPAPTEQGKAAPKDKPGKANQEKGGDIKAVRTFKTPAEFFAGMPEESYPIGGEDGGIERTAAQKWIRQNCIGQRIEWETVFQEVVIAQPKGQDDVYCVSLEMKNRGPWDVPFVFPKIKCQIRLNPNPDADSDSNHLKSSRTLFLHVGGYVHYGPADAATAKTLRAWKGKMVLLRSTILKMEMEYDKTGFGKGGPEGESVYLYLVLTTPTIEAKK